MSTEPSDPVAVRELFRERLRDELCSALGLPGPVPDARMGYRRAASLLTAFDPRALRLPGEERATGRAVMELTEDCTAAGTAEGARWTLTPEAREAALRSLEGPEAALRALEGNLGAVPEGAGPERACLALLRGEPPRVRGTDAEELADLLQAVLWLARVPGVTGLPGPEAVRRELDRARLIQPLERLVRAPFVGRAAQLAGMRRHVTDPADADGSPAPPLLVHGRGGMGKSTLMAHFLLDALSPDDQPAGTGTGREFPFPFAYIDFERPSLSVHEPITMVAETARQLSVQFPAFHDELEALADEGLRLVRDQRAGEEQVADLNRLAATRAGLGRRSSREFLEQASEQESALFRRVGEVLARAVAPEQPPFLIVLDSFEEAQYRWSPVLGRMWAIYFAFCDTYPHARFVVSGRAPVGHPAAGPDLVEIELRDLDTEASVELLRQSGVTDEPLARELAERVGGHPLSLRLAARAVALAGGDAAGLRDLMRSLPERRRDFFRQVDQLLVQGILYERILQHIPDEDVRRLAHAGLVLRVITPEVVREVLAGACGVEVPGAEAARRLFGTLSRLDLVEPVGPEAVRVRPDVRAIMLRLADSDPDSLLPEVERRAVAYYAGREGTAARAEEIYHRLRLNENPRTVEERWLPGVTRLLAGAEEEMSPRSAALLTAHSGQGRGRASELVMAEADQEDWERITAHGVEDLLAQGFTHQALSCLEERRPWTPCGPLHVLLAEALSATGRRAEARGVVSDAIERAREAGCGERRLELLLLSARLAQEDGDRDAADRELRLAEDVAIGRGQHLEAMGTLLARARLEAGMREQTGAGPEAGVPVRERAGEAGVREADAELARRLRGIPDRLLAGQPALVRGVASQVYTLDARALDHALQLVGLPDDERVLEVLGSALRRAVERDAQLLPPLMDILHRAAGPVQGAPARSYGSGGCAPRPPGKPEGPPNGRPSPSPAAPPPPAGPGDTPASGVTDILRLARERGTLDELTRRLLVLRDRDGQIAAGVASALRTGTGEEGP
ncbi:AAA family ATPase [Streptomyces sp. MUM 203J]|uniref:AAA family ATPase n=1 Tax=Streptomyces sp. MUM 203J TaxID=2791990 RepID=UPI0027E3D422|nr:AAA family ATPase [Streptomyces sp. MUM 203J]MCH0538918.1 AAA family ATPase [Streptomyces sp. MUM 203J]